MSYLLKQKSKLKGKIILFFSFLAISSVVAPALLVSLVTPVLAHTQSERKLEANQLLQQGIQQFQISQYQEALESWQKALTIYQEIRDRQGEANSLMNLGSAYRNLGQYPKGVKYYRQSLAIFQEIRDRQGEADSMGNLGNTYEFLGKSPKAIEYSQKSLTISQEIGDRQGEADSLMNLGNAYSNLGQYQKVVKYYQQSLALFQEIGNRNGEANSLMNLGNAYSNLGQYQKAIEYYQQSLALFQEIGNRNGEGLSLMNFGVAYRKLGQYQKAIEYYQQSLTIFQEIGDRNGKAKSLGNLAIAYDSLGQYPKAIEYSQKSLAISQEVGDHNSEARSIINLGTAYFNLGHFTKAIEYYQKSLAIFQEIGDRQGEVYSIINLGSVYREKGKYLKAIEFYQQSLALSQEIGDRSAEGFSLMDLGIVYDILGSYSKAIEYYQQSLALFQEIGNPNGEANSLQNLGIVYDNLGEYTKAIEYYQQSLAIFQEISDREGEGTNLSNLGESYELQQKPELAIVFYKQSIIIREEIRQDIRVLDRELQESYTETVAGTYRSLADLLLSQDRIYEAQQVLELLKIQEIQDFTRNPSVRGELPKVVLLPQEAEIIKNYSQLILFAADIDQCEKDKCSQLSALRDQRDILKRQYNQDVLALETTIREWDAKDDSLLLPTSFNQTADRIIKASDKYNTEPGTVVIYPLVLKDKLWLLWAAQGKVLGKREITNVGRQQLNQEVLNLRLLLQDPNSDIAELQKTSQQLYNWLIKPIEGELEAGNIKHLSFSLDRGFRYIPMAVLHDGEKYLIEKYTVTTFISAEFTDTVDRLPDKQEETPIIGVGASEFSGYDPLPHVLTEIDSIVREDNSQDKQGIYPGTKFVNKTFNFDNLRDNLAGRKLLHIATHGEFVPGNQYDSFLVLGDGEKLSIPDIQVLDDYLDDVHLVVLSACETAVGESFLSDPKQEEGIEINALSFYFLHGGAKTVMASLWRVDDASTSQLMQRFYCTLANNPSITKAQALKQAQESLLNNTPLDCEQSTSENADFSHPHYWAPFILIGNGL
ncbi:MAG: tetratricopeptide repeat protein [Cyanobacteria bacterium P01_F01_bin.143]